MGSPFQLYTVRLTPYPLLSVDSTKVSEPTRSLLNPFRAFRMPTELTPPSYSPFSSSPQFRGWADHHPPPFSSSMPSTGPARAIDCLPGPNKCLPNGLRNPWLPYAGESYIPASVGAVNQQYHAASIHGGGGSVGGSVIAPSRMGVSVIAPRSFAGSAMSYQNSAMGRDEFGGRAGGWGGALERDHNDLEPDLSSVAGALPIRPSSAAWHYTASSPGNHAPLSQARFGGGMGSFVNGPEAYGQPEYRPRRASMRGPPVDECLDCQPHVHVQKRRPSGGQSDRERMVPMTGSLQSPYRKISGGSPVRGSPLRPADQPLSRKASTRSHRSSGSQRPCSECSCR